MNIAVLVSGGVDSSVALKLLKDQGHTVTAFYLKIWLEDELSFLGTCPWQEDLSYVQAVCEKFDVPLKVISLQKEYWDRVVSYTIAEVKAGRTPNPDILCNQHVKFGAFLDAIDDSYDKVATGHYAHIQENGTSVSLVQSPDLVKDQTYFLSHLSQKQLSRALFPLGTLSKHEVRALAHKYDIPTKNRKDSQGICFLGKLKFADFLKFHLGENPGNLIEVETGANVGTHNGFWFYTIGQRKGLGLSGGPWYVVNKDVSRNIVYVSRNYYADDKARDTFYVSSCNWINEAPTSQELQVKIRHGALMVPARIESLKKGSYRVVLAQRDQGIAPGQFAAFYADGHCLGSGVIQNTE